MTHRFATAAAILGLGLAAGAPAIAQSGGSDTADAPQSAVATVKGTDGTEMGTVTLTSTESGIVTVTLDLEGVPEGSHGVHIHETGDCSAADFKSAGGHLAGDADHGVKAANGPHPGDLPNAIATESGVVHVEYFDDRLDMAQVLDDDGAAFVVHSGADDYATQPSGDSGDRIACGVFEADGS